jgi:hypothetical protein
MPLLKLFSNTHKISDRSGLYSLVGLGVLVLSLNGAIVYISGEFEYARWDITPFIWQYIALASGLGVLLLVFLGLVGRVRATPKALAVIFIVGLAARAMMFVSTPVLEDDWHRYLWDGASVANGIDPYKFAPAQAAPVNRLGEEIPWSDDPELLRLQELTEEDFTVFWRVNYPFFKTIYPPIAQAGFGLAHFISPYNLNGWRTVLLLVDLISFALIVWVLGLYGRSYLWAGLYWWNPVVLLEVFNAGHMDTLIVPFLVGALGLARLGKYGFAVTALAAAAAVKLWPALLAPMLVRKYMFDFKRLMLLAGLFCIVALVLLWPQLRYVFSDPDQGLVAYSEAWRRHAFLYSVLVEGPFRWFGDPVSTARGFVLLCVAGGALWFAYRSPYQGRLAEEERMSAGFLAVTALLLFLSPTGYPWYQVWLAGLIPFAPRLGYVVLTIMAPIYYIRFILGDQDPVYQWIWVPLAFGVPLLLLLVPRSIYRRDVT